MVEGLAVTTDAIDAGFGRRAVTLTDAFGARCFGRGEAEVLSTGRATHWKLRIEAHASRVRHVSAGSAAHTFAADVIIGAVAIDGADGFGLPVRVAELVFWCAVRR